ncbi:endochitinase [Coprinopsis sp. MPI-PUGE-AT-0042]|nr:endochitinase [Coprinopsis sp. MPI-PUGE-AT-0042]
MLLLAALPLSVTAAPARLAHGSHHGSRHSILGAAQHGSYLSKRLVTPRHEGHSEDQNCTDTDDGPGPVEVEVVASGWYASWEKANMPVADIPWQQYSQLTFAFALPLEDGTLSLGGEEATLQEFTKTARANNVDPYVSLGGYTGSRFFSPLVATPEKRAAFIQEIVKMATDYDLAGIDFDWEYPNGGGLECNMKSPDDTANFLALLQELKQDPVGKTLGLTAATHIAPFHDAAGTPSADVSAFAEVLDQIAIMAYDIHGPWSKEVGANAPLRDECPAGRDGSVTTAVEAWTSAGFPANKLILGVAAYGRAFHPTSDVVDAASGSINVFNPPHDTANIPFGENEDEKTDFGNDVCGKPSGPSGVFTFNGLITAGLLTSEGGPLPNIASSYDNCTETPFLYNPETNTMISYDDTRSMAAKGAFIVEKNMLGFAVWHIAGDSRNNLLTGALWESMGIIANSTEAGTPAEQKY